MNVTTRWFRFNAVGILGFVLQLGMLALLAHGLHWNVLLATAIAVESALLHNFFWHERYTWADRTRMAQDRRSVAMRLLAFHLGNGAVSLVGNMVLMAWLAGQLGMPPLPANLVSVLVCALVNFLIGDRMVFRPDLTPVPPDRTAALAGLATAYCADAPDSAPRRPAVRHANKVPSRERQEEHGRGGGEGEAQPDLRPEQQRRESPKLVENSEQRKDALELLARRPQVEGDARQPI